jgi:hypothetical protein
MPCVRYWRRYDDASLKSARKDAPKFTDAEMKIIGAPLDFVGINVYIPILLVMASDQPPGYREVPFNASQPSERHAAQQHGSGRCAGKRPAGGDVDERDVTRVRSGHGAIVALLGRSVKQERLCMHRYEPDVRQDSLAEVDSHRFQLGGIVGGWCGCGACRGAQCLET